MATMRQMPSERVIKRDYVKFCETDKSKAKEEVEKAFKAAKAERKAALSEMSGKDLDKAQKLEEKGRIKFEYEQKIAKFDLTKQILLLDEHTAALDPKTAQKVLDLTEKIVTENQMTTIMITHNMKDAIRYGNRLIMMSHGKVVVDISGEEKKKLTVKQLLDMFQVASKDDAMSDSAILGD